MADQQSFSIGELAKVAGMTVRAVRYYVSLGLLSPPDEKGSAARYGNDHLERLQLIEQLKARRLSLSEINHMLSTLSRDEIAELIGRAILPHTEPDAGVGEVGEMLVEGMAASMASTDLFSRARAPRRSRGSLRTESGPSDEGSGETELWVRQRITDGIEIHHKTPLPEDDEAKLFDLVSRARAMFRERSSKDAGSRRGPSRFFHRLRNRSK